MASSSVANGGPAQILKSGPEDLVAASSVIVAGPVSGYSRKVQKYSAPGPDGFPVEWTTEGEIKQPQLLKGEAIKGTIRFSRAERSSMLPVDLAVPLWERQYGELSADGQAVLFLGSGNPRRVLKVLPSGTGNQDLAGLVRAIVRIQSLQDSGQRQQAWLNYLGASTSDEGRRSALRSLVHDKASWKTMTPALAALFGKHGASLASRGFAFEFVAFHITEETWGHQTADATALLCQVASSEPDPNLVLRYLQGLKMVLDYTVEEPLQESRQPLRQHILQSLEKWATTGLKTPDLKEEYDQIRADYSQP